MVVSTIHEAVKFHTTQGIGTVFSTHESDKIEGVMKFRETSPANTEGILSCTDLEEKIIINNRTNADVFAWTHADMTGIPRTIMVNGKLFHTKHKLNEYSHIKLIKQKRRSLGPDHSTTACREVEEFTRAGILREAVHHTWVANPVMVKKSDGGCRMCVEFTDINKAFSKDYYPLPEIDWKRADHQFQTRDDSNKEMPKDFLIKAPPEDNMKEVERKTNIKLEDEKLSFEWKFYIDEALSFDGSSVGLMLIDPKGKEYTYALRFKFETTNNKAEYEALLARLKVEQEMEIVNLTIFVDSQLLVNQVKGIYATKQPAIREYLQRTKETLGRSTSQSPCEKIHRGKGEDPKESRKIRIKVPQYKLIKGSLYKKSFYTPWLRCIALPKTNVVIKEIHEAKDDRGRTKEMTKRKESKEVASIEKAYYQNELQRYHSKRNSPSNYKATHEPSLDKAHKGVRLKVLQILKYDRRLYFPWKPTFKVGIRWSPA
ncbi:reverse transcriptase domain-containing protein [Tanacetum coccineum]